MTLPPGCEANAEHRAMRTIRTRELPTMSQAHKAGPAPIERYTEADIARLEREDLTDLTVIAKLREAYRQNDPNEEGFFPGFRRSATDFTIGTEEDFERWIAEAEAQLQSNPTDYMTRTKRLYAMAGRETMHRREELRARHPGLCDSRWRMPSTKESDAPKAEPGQRR